MIEHHGKPVAKPVAALVSVEDLAWLEESSSGSVEERYREALEKARIEISYPDPDKRVPKKRQRIRSVSR